MAVQSTYNVVVPLQASGDRRLHVLFNAMAGSLDVIDDDVARFLDLLPTQQKQLGGEYGRYGLRPAFSLNRSREVRPPSDAVLQYLDRRGYLFESHDRERVQSQLMYEQMLELHKAAAKQPIVVIPTYNCNLKCPYCWQRQYDMDSGVMSAETAHQLFEALPGALGVPLREARGDLVIFGGEPLQDRDDLRSAVMGLLNGARENGMSSKIISNGVGLASNVPHLKGRVELLQITIDGLGELHRKRRPLPSINGAPQDSFRPMVEGVDRAIEAGIRVNVRVNVDEANLPLLGDLADFMADRGWLASGLCKPHLSPVKNHNPKRETKAETSLLRTLFAALKSDPRLACFDLTGFQGLKYFQGFMETGVFSFHRFFNCEAQINFFAFDLYGDVYACWDAAGIKEHRVGTFAPALAIDDRALNKWRGRGSLEVDSCSTCASSPHCGGGCQFLSLEHAGKFDAPACDSMMEGYLISIAEHAEWILERASAGDHAIGLVDAASVNNPVTSIWGILERTSPAFFQCEP